MIKFVSETLLPTKLGDFRVRAYRDDASGDESLALIVGDTYNKKVEASVLPTKSLRMSYKNLGTTLLMLTECSGFQMTAENTK